MFQNYEFIRFASRTREFRINHPLIISRCAEFFLEWRLGYKKFTSQTVLFTSVAGSYFLVLIHILEKDDLLEP